MKAQLQETWLDRAVRFTLELAENQSRQPWKKLARRQPRLLTKSEAKRVKLLMRKAQKAAS